MILLPSVRRDAADLRHPAARSARVARSRFDAWTLPVLVALAGLLSMAGPLSAAGPKLEYNRDIRPILAENCFACHGPDSAARKGDLRLDLRDAAIEHKAFAPGRPEASELLARIRSTDAEVKMPPPATKKTLNPKQAALLEQWIREGAEYQLHWSFIAPRRPAPPVVKNAGWVQQPLDRFVLARLEKEGLAPAPEADRTTLARRAALDVTGLPPTPEMLAAFLGDAAPGAYERYVDRLLESPGWGEHRARYWLDYSRYADTHGIHFDNFREMWTYRDWVIKAFARNMPWDRFTIENLAGDLLPDATLEQKIGSGFNRCNMTTNEGGIIDEEYLVLYTRDRTETTAQVWMGMTAGCAVCHSHKFDPLTQNEFYELAAFFNNTTQAARDGNIKDTPPVQFVLRDEDVPRHADLTRRSAEAKSQVEEHRRRARLAFDAWAGTATPQSIAEAGPRTAPDLSVPFDEGEGEAFAARVDGTDSVAFPFPLSAAWIDGPTGKGAQLSGGIAEFPSVGDYEADEPFSVSAWVRVAANDSTAAICSRMNVPDDFRGWDLWLQRRQIGMHVVSSWPDKGLKVLGKAQIPANQWVHVAVTYDGSRKASGVKVYYDGKPQATVVESDKLAGSIRTEVPFRVGERTGGSPFQGGLSGLRVDWAVLAPGDVESLAQSTKYRAILAKKPAQRSDAETNDLFGFWLGSFDDEYGKRTKAAADVEKELAAVRGRGTIAHVMLEKPQMPEAFVLFRGDYDKRRDKVTPDTPDILPPFPADLPRNRLGFAQWLLLPEHPLTARVTVNRFWQEVFGTGIVRTTGDFGVAGELPSHPELLDWLAVDFREGGWDVKRLFRSLLLSATYRQSARATRELVERDPENRLLARGPRFRMDAEMVRDNALAASGLLVRKVGGPSVKPYQPDGVWEAIAMNVSNTRSYQRDSGENLWRRSLYTFWKRMAPPASLDILNAPNREYCVVRRERTNTPLQALVTLNDEQFVEAARNLAQVALKQGGADFEARLRTVSLRLVAREFRPEEREIVRRSLDALRAEFKDRPAEAAKLLAFGESKRDETLDPAEHAAWTMLCNQLMNLDEVLCK